MNMHVDHSLLTQLQSLAADTAREAGALIHRLRASGVSVAETKSSITDVVTHADQAAEEHIVQAISRARPQDGIVGEEGHSISGTSGITWVIDPIDGTVNYLYDLPTYCVSIAACVDDAEAYEDGRRAIAAAVFNPQTGEMFEAAEGLGATRNGVRVTTQTGASLAESLVATGFGYTAERRIEQMQILGRVIPHVRDIRRIGSAAYDLCLVASGRLNAYFERGIQPWDWAAAALVATEAGAVTLGKAEGDAPGSTMFIAGPEKIARELQALIAGA